MEERIIRAKELSERLGVTRQSLYEWEKKGKIPPRFKLTENGRASGWLSSEIEMFFESRRDTAQSNYCPEEVEKVEELEHGQ